jgi:uncharacterized protein
MILIDANLLLHAYNASSPQHAQARQWLEQTFVGDDPIRIAWTVLLAFIRISTNPRAFVEPLTARDAVTIVSDWLKQPGVAALEPGDRHWEILSGLLIDAQVQGPLVMDAHLAALAIENGATLCSTDQDFRRFPTLKFRNPLIS